MERCSGGAVEPAVDISENNEEVSINAELPGMKTEDVYVEVAGEMLTINGEKKEEKEKKGEAIHWVERSFGTYSRSSSLTREIQHYKAGARNVDGVLTLRLPKTESSKTNTKKIDIRPVG